MHIQKIIGFTLIVASLGLIAFQATKNESTVTFYTPAEVYEDPSRFNKKIFRVSGLVLEDTKVWDDQTRVLTFKMSDLQGHDFTVSYKGVPPDLFKERQGVIVEGQLTNLLSLNSNSISTSDSTNTNPLHINANLLMVKHSEVYDTKGDHSQMRELKLRESLFDEVKN